jgi:hypothetical protein
MASQYLQFPDISVVSLAMLEQSYRATLAQVRGTMFGYSRG